MATSSVVSAFKDKSSRPYSRPIKCKVMAIDTPLKFKAKDGTQKECLNVVVSDGQEVCKLTSFDASKFRYLKVGQTLVLRDVIRRSDQSDKVLIVTSVTKVFITTGITVPEEHKSTAEQLLHPPPAETVSIKLALSSSLKKRVSISGRIVSEDEPRIVKVRGDEVSIKSIKLDDGTEKAKISLWRECASTEAHPGEFIEITDVIVNSYNNSTSLSTTTKSKVKVCAAPEESRVIVVEGICTENGQAELYLQDESVLAVPVELLQSALVTEAEPNVEVELATQDGPITLTIVKKGTK